MKLLLVLLLAMPVAAQNAVTLQELRDANFSVITPDGEIVPFAKIAGEGHPVVIEFWATWCAPCRRTVPHLIELNRTYGPKGLVVVGLTLENAFTDAQKVKRFIAETGVPYTIAFAPRDLYLRANRARTISLPRILVFDAKGQLVEHILNYGPETGERLRSAIAKLYSSRATSSGSLTMRPDVGGVFRSNPFRLATASASFAFPVARRARSLHDSPLRTVPM